MHQGAGEIIEGALAVAAAVALAPGAVGVITPGTDIVTLTPGTLQRPIFPAQTMDIPQPQGRKFPVLSKTLVRDLLPDLTADHGLVIEKVEGLAILRDGKTLIVTDNDGVDGSSGETQLINLGAIFE